MGEDDVVEEEDVGVVVLDLHCTFWEGAQCFPVFVLCDWVWVDHAPLCDWMWTAISCLETASSMFGGRE